MQVIALIHAVVLGLEVASVDAKRAKLLVGAKVEGNWEGEGYWYRGVIAVVNPDGTYDIQYDDGEAEEHVKIDLLRLVEPEEGATPDGDNKSDAGEVIDIEVSAGNKHASAYMRRGLFSPIHRPNER